MRTILVLLCVLAYPLRAATTITLLHVSDYHAHALPFYTDEGERGGIARAIAHLAREKKHGALVFSGGDTINKGAPAWSDKYGCAEWPWWNGIVSAMAFGNHDPDYGRAEYEQCARSVRYPVLSANTAGFPRYSVFTVRGIRIGVFALAGADFPSLVHVEGFSFGDPVAAARDVVRDLRDKEHVDAVVLIGHEHLEADYALAREVPGIDLIFGSHSHLKRELTLIPGTRTWFISPWQYLGYISRVELTFEGHSLRKVRGRLVPVDASMREDRRVARRVARMQRELEKDPAYRDLFKTVAVLGHAMTTREFAMFTLDAVKRAVSADLALSTVSSFRAALPRGAITMEQLRAALPYDNEIVTCTMNGSALQRVLEESAKRTGSDSESFVRGAESIDPSRTYRVATTDYLANIAYRDVFDCAKEKSGQRVRAVVTTALSE